MKRKMDAKNETRQPKTAREYISLYLTGLGMGAADTVPGVSGGTIAFVRGIYDDLLNAIKSFNLDLIKLILKRDFKAAFTHIPWRFLLTLGLGVLTAVFTLARFVSWAMENQRVYLFAFFFGLVLASAVAVASKVEKWNLSQIIGLIVGGIAAFIVVGLVPRESPHGLINLFLSGFVAIMAMILPGISGSSILLILGQYEYVLNAVKTFNIVPLIALALGCVAGIVIFARVLSWLLRTYNQVTLAVLIGLVIGSLRAVWPWQVDTTIVVEGVEEVIRTNILPNFASAEFLIALVFALIGFLLVCLIDHLESGSNPVMRLVWRNNAPVTSTAE